MARTGETRGAPPASLKIAPGTKTTALAANSIGADEGRTNPAPLTEIARSILVALARLRTSLRAKPRSPHAARITFGRQSEEQMTPCCRLRRPPAAAWPAQPCPR